MKQKTRPLLKNVDNPFDPANFEHWDPDTKIASPEWRLSHLYKITTKDRRLAIMKPNPAQTDYYKNRSLRDMILKARRIGFSTFRLIEMLDDTLTTNNINSAVIAHERDKVQKLFKIIKLAFNHLPEELKPRVSYDSKNELEFPDLNSKIYVAMDTRSETVHNLHVSEVAFIRDVEDKMLGILESVPNEDQGGKICFESTANGMGGYYYDTWDDERNEFKKHFYNWVWDPENSTKTDEEWDELIGEYIPLADQYGLIPRIWDDLKLTKEQFRWYIAKARRNKKKMAQEYPSTALEAFITSGRNVFDMRDIQAHKAITPIMRKWGKLEIWEEPLEDAVYSIGVDVGEGLGLDNSVIEVYNAGTGVQAGEYVSNDIPPEELGEMVVAVAKYYNHALVVPEINNQGIATLNKIKNLKYTNRVYRREIFDKNSKSYVKRGLGWKTTKGNKAVLISNMNEALSDKTITINSEIVLKETRTFVYTDEGGRQGMGAENGKKDDTIIATSLALWGFKELPSMKKKKSIAQEKMEEHRKNSYLIKQGKFLSSNGIRTGNNSIMRRN